MQEPLRTQHKRALSSELISTTPPLPNVAQAEKRARVGDASLDPVKMAPLVALLSKADLVALVLSLLQTPSIAPTVGLALSTALLPARTAFFDSVLARLEASVRSVEDDPESDGTADDFADAAQESLAQVPRLRQFPGRGTTAMAFELVLRIAEATLCDMDRPNGAGFGERRSFEDETDALLVELAALRKVEDPEWKVGELYNDLKATSRTLKEYGIPGWFPRTIALVAPWAREQMDVLVLDD